MAAAVVSGSRSIPIIDLGMMRPKPMHRVEGEYREHCLSFLKEQLKKGGIADQIESAEQQLQQQERYISEPGHKELAARVNFEFEFQPKIDQLVKLLTPTYLECIRELMSFALNLNEASLTREKQLQELMGVLQDLKRKKWVTSSILETLTVYSNGIDRALKFYKEQIERRIKENHEERVLNTLNGTAAFRTFPEFDLARDILRGGGARADAPFVFIRCIGMLIGSRTLSNTSEVALTSFQMIKYLEELSHLPVTSSSYRKALESIFYLGMGLKKMRRQFSLPEKESRKVRELTSTLILGMKSEVAGIIGRIDLKKIKEEFRSDASWMLTEVGELNIHPVEGEDKEIGEPGIFDKGIDDPRTSAEPVRGSMAVVPVRFSASHGFTVLESDPDRCDLREMARLVQHLEGFPKSIEVSNLMSVGEWHVAASRVEHALNASKLISKGHRNLIERTFRSGTMISHFLFWVRNHVPAYDTMLKIYSTALERVEKVLADACANQESDLKQLDQAAPHVPIPDRTDPRMREILEGHRKLLQSMNKPLKFSILMDDKTLLNSQFDGIRSFVADPISRDHPPLICDHLLSLFPSLKFLVVAEHIGLGRIRIVFNARSIAHRNKLGDTIKVKPGENFFHSWCTPVVEFELSVYFIHNAKTIPILTAIEKGNCHNQELFAVGNAKNPPPGLVACAILEAWNNKSHSSIKPAEGVDEAITKLVMQVSHRVVEMRRAAVRSLLDPSKEIGKHAAACLAQMHEAREKLKNILTAVGWNDVADVVSDKLWTATSLQSHFTLYARSGRFEDPLFLRQGMGSVLGAICLMDTNVVIAPTSCLRIQRKSFDLLLTTLGACRRRGLDFKTRKIIAEFTVAAVARNLFLRMSDHINKQGKVASEEYARQLQRKDETLGRTGEDLRKKDHQIGILGANLTTQTARADALAARLGKAEEETKKLLENAEREITTQATRIAGLMSQIVGLSKDLAAARAQVTALRKQPDSPEDEEGWVLNDI